MRPAGEVRQALLDAAQVLTTETTAPTLMELAAHSQVGSTAALFTIRNMVKSGALVIVRTRRVDYRNRPVAEYSTPSAMHDATGGMCDFRTLAACWATQAA